MELDYSDKVKYHDKILRELIDSKNKEKLLPFIGAGFSKNVKNYPDWQEFTEKLSIDMREKKYYLKEQTGGNGNYLVMAADYYSIKKFRADTPIEKFNRTDCKKKLQYAIQNIINAHGLNKKSEIHKYLLRHFPYIFTTNWDDLLEDNDERSKFKVISKVTHISEIYQYEKEGKRLIIKIHGDYKDPENIIATEIDYLELSNNKNQPLNIKFQNEILHKDFLFLGFSFDDPNINNLSYPIHIIKQKEFKENTSPNAPNMFMLNFSEYDPILAEFYNELKGIVVFFLDVAETDRKTATQIFLKDVVKGTTNILNDALFREKLISELDKEENKISQKIKFLRTGIRDPNFKALRAELNKEVEYLKFKLEKIRCKKINID